MELVRATDAHHLNTIVNDPSVAPMVRGNIVGEIDLSVIVENRNNYALVGKYGAVVFAKHQLGLYEAHSQVLPVWRGPQYIEMLKAALFWQFTHTDAIEIWMKAPQGDAAAQNSAHQVGARFLFRSERGWIINGDIVPADIYSITVQDWMASAPGLVEIGEWFHARVDAELALSGVERAHFQEDADFNRYVGASVEMLRNGQAQKGTIFYNRFAAIAGIDPLRLLRDEPVTVGFHDAVLEFHGRNFFVASMARERH